MWLPLPGALPLLCVACLYCCCYCPLCLPLCAPVCVPLTLEKFPLQDSQSAVDSGTDTEEVSPRLMMSPRYWQERSTPSAFRLASPKALRSPPGSPEVIEYFNCGFLPAVVSFLEVHPCC